MSPPPSSVRALAAFPGSVRAYASVAAARALALAASAADMAASSTSQFSNPSPSMPSPTSASTSSLAFNSPASRDSLSDATTIARSGPSNNYNNFSRSCSDPVPYHPSATMLAALHSGFQPNLSLSTARLPHPTAALAPSRTSQNHSDTPHRAKIGPGATPNATSKKSSSKSHSSKHGSSTASSSANANGSATENTPPIRRRISVVPRQPKPIPDLLSEIGAQNAPFDNSLYTNTRGAPIVTWKVGSQPLAIPPTSLHRDLLTQEELETCSTLRIYPDAYFHIKKTMLLAVRYYGPFKKREAQAWFRIDVNKICIIYDWFKALGWIPAGTGEWNAAMAGMPINGNSPAAALAIGSGHNSGSFSDASHKKRKLLVSSNSNTSITSSVSPSYSVGKTESIHGASFYS